jgi:hypothetical protein
MTYAQFNSIEASDFNTLIGNNPGNTANALNTVWAIGNSSAGYGQPAVSNVAIGNTVGNLEWDSLINNTRTAAAQQGSTITSVTAPSTGNIIAYISAVTNNLTTIYNNRLNAVAQGPNVSNTVTNSSTWASNILFTQTAYFANGDAARYFFNAGGQLVITCAQPTGSTIDNVFHGIAANIGNVTLSAPTSGTITIAGNSGFSGVTKVGGGGQTPSILPNSGYYALTTSNANIFTQTDGVDFTFSASYINIKVKTNGPQGSHGDAGNSITFYTTWQEVPSGTTVSAGASTTITAIYPSTSNIANTWGTVSFSSPPPPITSTTTTTTSTTTVPPVLDYTYTVPGTYNLAPIPGYPYLTLTMVGGGGGGGGNDGYGDTRAGGGGGSGGYTNVVLNTTGTIGNFVINVAPGGAPANVTFNGIAYPGIPGIPRTGTKSGFAGGQSSVVYSLGNYSANGGGGGIGNTGDNGDGVGGAGGTGVTTNGNPGVTPITDRNIYVAAAGGASVFGGYGAGGASQNSNFGTNLDIDLPQPGGNGYVRMQFSNTMPTTTTTTTTTIPPVGTINTALFTYLTGSSFFAGQQDFSGVFLTFYSTGSFGIVDQNATSLLDGAPNHNYWISGAVSPGSSYWVKFTQTAVFGSPTSPSTGWLWLYADQTVYVTAGSSGYYGTTDSTYTIQIATDSAGTNIVATATGVFLSATAYPPPIS